MATAGEQFECRVARVLHHEGAFVRRAVDLNLQFGARFTVTDIDVLALTFLPSLRRQVTICECKTTQGSGPTAGDRLLWGAGVRQLVPGADRHMVATVRTVTDKIRGLAAELNAEVVDERDLLRREQFLSLDPKNMSGPHDPGQVDLQKAVHGIVRADDELRRVWGFVRSEFWFADAVYGLKRGLGALRLLGRRWHPDLPAEEAETVRWLVEEVTVTVVVAMVEIAGDCYRQPKEVFERDLSHSLAEGIMPFEQMQTISKQVDEFVLTVLRQAGAEPARYLGSLGALEPTVPTFAGPLIEVVERLAAGTRGTAELARLLDERIAARRGFPVPNDVEIKDGGDASLLLATVATFLRGQARLPEALLTPLVEGISNPESVGAGRAISSFVAKTGRRQARAKQDAQPTAAEPAQLPRTPHQQAQKAGADSEATAPDPQPTEAKRPADIEQSGQPDASEKVTHAAEDQARPDAATSEERPQADEATASVGTDGAGDRRLEQAGDDVGGKTLFDDERTPPPDN